jgi:type IV pilus assembly protein PilN
MASINLLPWRENLRAQRLREFGLMVVAGLVLTLLAMWGWHTFNVSLIEYQQQRNQYLTAEIKKVDKQLKEIRTLEKTKRQLISRMKVVESLQSSRPQIVHLFDELVSTLPDGVYLTQVTQKGGSVNVLGKAQSNARVSAYMRGIEASPWLTSPSLGVIEAKGKENTDDATFSLGMKQVKPKGAETADGAKPGKRAKGARRSKK